MKNLVIQVVLLSGFCLIGLSQSSIDALGGHAKSLSFSFSYSVGEVVTSTLKSASGNYFATSGVIQPEPLLIIDVHETFLNNHILYPNPVKNIIHFYPNVSSDIQHTIYSIEGIPIVSAKLINSTINVQDLGSGLYLLKLSSEKATFSKIFQFIKL